MSGIIECRNCAFYWTDPRGGESDGECRRRSPSALVWSEEERDPDQPPYAGAVWPRVNPFNGCGEGESAK